MTSYSPSNIILNDPKCKVCADYGYNPGAGVPTGIVPSGPGAVIQDSGPVNLLANVNNWVPFSNISVLNETGWTFSGVPWAHNDSGTVGVDITSRLGTGFYANPMEDCILEFTAIKKNT